MDRKSLRKFNLYLNTRKKDLIETGSATKGFFDGGSVKGQMGARDANTGKYFTTLNNQGVIPTKFIGQGNGRPLNSTVEIDKRGWADG